MTDPRRHAPATQRNREAIAEQLTKTLPASGLVLEVASGTGEHACHFADLFPNLEWLPSEPDATLRASIAAYRDDCGLPNLALPLALDVTRRPWPCVDVAAILCVNLLHISPWTVAEALFAGAAEALSSQAPLLIYGPFKRGGQHTADSNAAFDRILRAESPSWGLRDLNDIETCALQQGFSLDSVVDMPANNFFLHLKRI